MKDAIKHLLFTSSAIILTGIVLDLAAKGLLGAWAQGIAKTATSGYGSINS